MVYLKYTGNYSIAFEIFYYVYYTELFFLLIIIINHEFKIEYSNYIIYNTKMNSSTSKCASYLSPIDYSNGGVATDFIEKSEKILENFSDYSAFGPEFKFRKLDVYGSIENPYFVSSYVYKYIFPHRAKNKHGRFLDQFRNDNNEFNVDYMLQSNVSIFQKKKNGEYGYQNQTSVNLLSEMGLMKAMFMASTEFAITFQKLILNFLKGVRQTHVDVWKKQLLCSKKNLEAERSRRIEVEELNQKNIEISDAIYNTDNRDQNNLELNILRRKAMSRYSVYLVDWQFINTKYWKQYPMDGKTHNPPKNNKFIKHTQNIIEGIDLNSDDELTIPTTKTRTFKKINLLEQHPKGIESYQHTYKGLEDLEQDENTPYYIHISNKEIQKDKEHYKFLRFLYMDKESRGIHYKTMIDIIKNGEKYNNKSAYTNMHKISNAPECNKTHNSNTKVNSLEINDSETPVKKVYQITYSELMNARDRAFVKNNLNIIQTIKKERV